MGALIIKPFYGLFMAIMMSKRPCKDGAGPPGADPQGEVGGGLLIIVSVSKTYMGEVGWEL